MTCRAQSRRLTRASLRTADLIEQVSASGEEAEPFRDVPCTVALKKLKSLLKSRPHVVPCEDAEPFPDVSCTVPAGFFEPVSQLGVETRSSER